MTREVREGKTVPIPSVTGSTTSKPTTTSAPSTEAPITTTTPALTGEGEVVELPEYGMRFRLPAPLERSDDDTFLFSATSGDPFAVFVIEPCSDCSLDQPEPTGDTYIDGQINGVPVLIVQNADFGLPDNTTTNALMIIDDARSLTVAMTVDGDITPIWDAFIDSIELFPPSGAAPPSTSPPTAPVSTAATAVGTNTVTLDDLGLTFTIPTGYEDQTDPTRAEHAFKGRQQRPLSSLYIDSCPGCTGEELIADASSGDGDSVTNVEVAGYPAVVIDTDLVGAARIMLVMNPGKEFLVILETDDLDSVWEPLISSFKIA